MKNSFIRIVATACIASTAILLFSACCIYYVSSAGITYINNSSHNIEFSLKSRDHLGYTQTTDIALNPTESYTFTYNPGDLCYISPHDFTGYCTVIVFDNEIEIKHYSPNWNETDGIKEHSVCDNDSYDSKVSGKVDNKYSYTYTFTDKDYDRAVAANEKSEGQTE